MSDHLSQTSLSRLTLKQAIAVLVEEYQLSEVLDRLAELADFKAQNPETSDKTSKWQELARTLESATEQAKALELGLDHLRSDSDHL
ncbi:MAG: hypothetical protein KME43_21420 [Myxacorys chilensis ATA2-1-KO14]|jgi:DNA-binding GntR family transcriptional regulator|nr:hypothetical protein [Myxacorys chilensis ATA2-1-KO14]